MSTETQIEENKAIANEILNQLGGNRFIIMTGSKNFIAIERGLTFKIGFAAHQKKNRATHCEIKLEWNDTYTVKFFYVRGFEPKKEISKHEEIYCNMLQTLFTEQTGLYTHL